MLNNTGTAGTYGPAMAGHFVIEVSRAWEGAWAIMYSRRQGFVLPLSF